MDGLQNVSTGLLNYHLKVLSDLLSKNDKGEYILTEKGKLALKLLVEFPEENRQRLGLKHKWWRKFWIVSGILAMAFLIIHLASYFLGYTDIAGFYRGILWIVGAIGITWYTLDCWSYRNNLHDTAHNQRGYFGKKSVKNAKNSAFSLWYRWNRRVSVDCIDGFLLLKRY